MFKSILPKRTRVPSMDGQANSPKFWLSVAASPENPNKFIDKYAFKGLVEDMNNGPDAQTTRRFYIPAGIGEPSIDIFSRSVT